MKVNTLYQVKEVSFYLEAKNFKSEMGVKIYQMLFLYQHGHFFFSPFIY